MRIATWNINSIRIRFELIRAFVEKYKPDVLCLQETKTQDESFPHLEMQTLGFNYREIRGEKSYNGVAILSRIPIKLADKLIFFNDQSRHISVHLENDIELHNFYFPSGGDIADPAINNKFHHKLHYINNVAEWFRSSRSDDKKIILVGDLNIAPGKHDVWSHRQLLDTISHTYMEVYHFNKLMKSINFIDVGRELVSCEKKLYTWWSYKNIGWRENDKGRRLDHILATQNLKESLHQYLICKEFRDTQNPSDHVPVLIELWD